jgi:hypothetical protein
VVALEVLSPAALDKVQCVVLFIEQQASIALSQPQPPGLRIPPRCHAHLVRLVDADHGFGLEVRSELMASAAHDKVARAFFAVMHGVPDSVGRQQDVQLELRVHDGCCVCACCVLWETNHIFFPDLRDPVEDALLT